MRWYRLAADQGLRRRRRSSSGSAYANSKGALKDDAEAVKWYRLAAEQG